jgi:hypothetical protein
MRLVPALELFRALPEGGHEIIPGFVGLNLLRRRNRGPRLTELVREHRLRHDGDHGPTSHGPPGGALQVAEDGTAKSLTWRSV